MLKTKSETIATAGMLLAVGVILPFATAHGLGIQGTVLLPMHIPVFLCGLLCGPYYGAIVGLLLPILNCLLTGMPALYPNMPIMACELLTYGLVSGLLYHKTRLGRVNLGIFPTLLISMICGRVAYGLAFQALLFLSGSLKVLTVWGALITGIPGIVVQFLLVPGIVLVLNHYRRSKTAIKSAKNLIAQDTAVCVVIKDNTIIRTEPGRGIGPILKLYEEGVLKDAFVVDKIIGKASAMILALGGVKGCFGITVSQSAVNWLKAHQVPVSYEHCVAAIINRTGDGTCPMEQTVKNVDDASEALLLLKAKLEELRKNG
ncbi:MAG: ECF transporter S component [Clostridia bacterium]|nr:ECF transporter S component [Clostridia bacterium]